MEANITTQFGELKKPRDEELIEVIELTKQLQPMERKRLLYMLQGAILINRTGAIVALDPCPSSSPATKKRTAVKGGEECGP